MQFRAPPPPFLFHFWWNLLFKILCLKILLTYFVYVRTQAMTVWRLEENQRALILSSNHVSPEWNSDYPAWQLMPLPAEPFHHPLVGVLSPRPKKPEVLVTESVFTSEEVGERTLGKALPESSTFRLPRSWYLRIWSWFLWFLALFFAFSSF